MGSESRARVPGAASAGAASAGAASAVAAAVALAACGQSVHDASVPSEPIVTIRGHVDVSSLTRVQADAPLIGALVWAAIPQVSPLCFKFDDPRIQATCPDPYGVFYGEIEHAAPVDADGNFDLPLVHLPKASVSVGDAVTRIAYGSLIVAEDVNGDGELSLVPPPTGGRRGGGGPSAQPPDYDVMVAATFTTLHADQQRVVFREGGFVEDSNFYPAPGCGVPPPGFSVLAAPAYTGMPAPAGACSFLPADTRMTLAPLTLDDGLALMCRPVQRGNRVREPQEDEKPSGDQTPICLDGGILAEVSGDICPRLTGYALKGCRSDPFCTNPDWDHTAAPPTWWPCPK